MRYFVDVLDLAGYGVGLEQCLLAIENQLLELAPRLLGGRKQEPDVFLVGSCAAEQFLGSSKMAGGRSEEDTSEEGS